MSFIITAFLLILEVFEGRYNNYINPKQILCRDSLCINQAVTIKHLHALKIRKVLSTNQRI